MNAGRLTIVVLTFALSSLVAPSQERVLHDFGSGRDGAGPFGNVVFDAAGNLYGTTQNGGIRLNGFAGVAFEIVP
jgi:hypothetical protein